MGKMVLVLVFAGLAVAGPAKGLPAPGMGGESAGSTPSAQDSQQVLTRSAAEATRSPAASAVRSIRDWVTRAHNRTHHLVNLVVAFAGLAWYAAIARRFVGTLDRRGPGRRGAAFLLLLWAVSVWVVTYSIRVWGDASGLVDEWLTNLNSALHFGMAVVLFMRLSSWTSLASIVLGAAVLSTGLTVSFAGDPASIEVVSSHFGAFCLVVTGTALIWVSPNRRLALACGLLIGLYADLQGRSDVLKSTNQQAFYYAVSMTKLAWILLVPAMLEKMRNGPRDGTGRTRVEITSISPPKGPRAGPGRPRSGRRAA